MKAGYLTCLIAFGLPVLAGVGVGQDEPKQLDAAGLKSMIEGLGYEVKDLVTDPGKEKYEFVVKTNGFNVPLGGEISPSKNYIWLTANLGAVKTSTKYEELLRANSAIQPSFFYVTKSNYLMIALAIENRGVTPSWLKKGIDKVGNDVEAQASVWNTGS